MVLETFHALFSSSDYLLVRFDGSPLQTSAIKFRLLSSIPINVPYVIQGKARQERRVDLTR